MNVLMTLWCAKYQVKAALFAYVETEQLDPKKRDDQLGGSMMSNYPLGQNDADTITSKTGKKLNEITLEEVKKGNVTAEDIKISSEMLKRQGKVAQEADNPQMTANFERASELVNVPDDVILDMYNKLRPNRSSKRNWC